ncbi:translation initiation factor [bacterium]|nr:translation initiation factor [bacterium]
MEKAGRGGKTVTIVEFRGRLADEAKSLHKELKTKCGTGGKLKGEAGELQGDQRAYVKELLEQKGYRVRGMV